MIRNCVFQFFFSLSIGSTSFIPVSQFVNLVLSRIDYCNFLLAGLPDKAIACLQRVQNAAARLTLRRGRLTSSSGLLKELRWPQVKQRILFKTATKAFRCRSPSLLRQMYLSSLLSSPPTHPLVLSDPPIQLLFPFLAFACPHTARGFLFFGPDHPELPSLNVTSLASVSTFKSKHLLGSAFPQ